MVYTTFKSVAIVYALVRLRRRKAPTYPDATRYRVRELFSTARSSPTSAARYCSSLQYSRLATEPLGIYCKVHLPGERMLLLHKDLSSQARGLVSLPPMFSRPKRCDSSVKHEIEAKSSCHIAIRQALCGPLKCFPMVNMEA